MLKSINQLYLEARISDNYLYNVKQTGNKLFYESRVVTTILPADRRSAIVWTDYNNSFPKSLVALRTEIEEIIGISRFFNHGISIETTSELK